MRKGVRAVMLTAITACGLLTGQGISAAMGLGPSGSVAEDGSVVPPGYYDHVAGPSQEHCDYLGKELVPDPIFGTRCVDTKIGDPVDITPPDVSSEPEVKPEARPQKKVEEPQLAGECWTENFGTVDNPIWVWVSDQTPSGLCESQEEIVFTPEKA